MRNTHLRGVPWKHILAGTTGFEPILAESRSAVLAITLYPNMVRPQGVEPCVPAYKTDPQNRRGQGAYLVGLQGLEPGTDRL